LKNLGLNCPVYLLREVEGDLVAVDFEGLDAISEGIVAEFVGDDFDEVFPFEVSEPSVGERDAPDREVIKDDRGASIHFLDVETGFCFQLLPAEERGIVGDLGIETGVDGILGEVEMELVAEIIESEEAVEFPFGEDDGLAPGDIVGGCREGLDGFDFLLEGRLFGGGEDGGSDGAVDPPPRRGTGGESDQKECSADQKGGAPAGWRGARLHNVFT
jgi:hypothetical protein